MTDTPNSSFQPASLVQFFNRYPFARKEDEELMRTMLATINTPQALAAMLRSIDEGEPPLAGVTDRIDAPLERLRARAAHDTSARDRLHRLTRISGVLVRDVLVANGYGKTGESLPMPREVTYFAKTAASFRLEDLAVA